MQSVSSTALIGAQAVSPKNLNEQLDRARARLDAKTELLQRSLDLREQIAWGLLDVEEARAEVAAFKAACKAARA